MGERSPEQDGKSAGRGPAADVNSLVPFPLTEQFDASVSDIGRKGLGNFARFGEHLVNEVLVGEEGHGVTRRSTEGHGGRKENLSACPSVFLLILCICDIHHAQRVMFDVGFYSSSSIL